MSKPARKTQPRRSPDQAVMSLSVPKSLKDRIAAAAEKEHRSVSNFMAVRLEEWLSTFEGKTRPASRSRK